MIVTQEPNSEAFSEEKDLHINHHFTVGALVNNN